MKAQSVISSPLYRVWGNMKSRCNNLNHPAYPRYGGRGIKVCDRWLVFANFAADMGEPAEGMSLDRIDNNGNYEPENCRWATAQQQSENRRNARYVTHEGQTMTVTQWARATGIKPSTLDNRLRYGWTMQEALEGTRDHRFKNAQPSQADPMALLAANEPFINGVVAAALQFQAMGITGAKPAIVQSRPAVPDYLPAK